VGLLIGIDLDDLEYRERRNGPYFAFFFRGI